MRLSFILLFPSLALAGSLDKGLHALIAGDYPSAQVELGQAVNEQPKNFTARFNYASALRANGDCADGAVSQFHSALSLATSEKERADALYNIALSEDALNHPAESAKAWNAYLSFAEGHPNEQPAIAVARERLTSANQMAAIPGTKKAAR